MVPEIIWRVTIEIREDSRVDEWFFVSRGVWAKTEAQAKARAEELMDGLPMFKFARIMAVEPTGITHMMK